MNDWPTGELGAALLEASCIINGPMTPKSLVDQRALLQKMTRLAHIEYRRAEYWKIAHERQLNGPKAKPGGTYERSLHEACAEARRAFHEVAGEDAKP